MCVREEAREEKGEKEHRAGLGWAGLGWAGQCRAGLGKAVNPPPGKQLTTSNKYGNVEISTNTRMQLYIEGRCEAKVAAKEERQGQRKGEKTWTHM